MNRRRVILLVVVLLAVWHVHGQSLSYSGHQVRFYDELDYTSLWGISKSVESTTYGTAFTANWAKVHGFKGGNTIMDSGQVFLSADTSCAHFISLAENYYADSMLYPVTDENNETTGHYYSRKSGMITMTYAHEFSYGIMEARIRFPDRTDPVDSIAVRQAAMPAFWTFSPNKTEIDIVDVAIFTDWMPLRVVDWHYYDNLHYDKNYGVTYNANSTQISAEPINIPDLTGWHIYSANWTPTEVSFYIDGHLLAQMPYSMIRTYPGRSVLQACLWAYDYTTDGQHMDIDWVKVWEPRTRDGIYKVQDHSAFSYIVPGIHKYTRIESDAPGTDIYGMSKTFSESVTVFEAEAVTLSANFLADESVLFTDYYILPASPTPGIPYFGSSAPYGAEGQPIFRNGYFEIMTKPRR